jgi:RNA polymerase subunit RPABC4/transcription elongation factor Spt4
MKKIYFCLSASLFALTQASGVVIVVAPTSDTSGSLQITQPISFPITQSEDAWILVFQNWVTSDGTSRFANLAPDLAFSLNENANTVTGIISDNLAFSTFDMAPNDGYLILDGGVSVVSGDTLTLSAGTYTISAVGDFNPQTTQSFTGNMFVADVNGSRISEIVAVPEPSAYAAVLGVVSLALLLRRRRRA